MSLKSLYYNSLTIYRVLAEQGTKLLVIDCIKRTMPVWMPREKMSEWQKIEEQTLNEKTGICPVTEEALSKTALASAHKRYSIIAPVVAVVADKKRRSEMIAFVVENNKISKQTLRKYLCLYLAFQTISILAPTKLKMEMKLSIILDTIWTKDFRLPRIP